MLKTKWILSAVCIMVVGFAFNAFAMMGGGYRNWNENHMNQDSYYRMGHRDTDATVRSYYPGTQHHMSADDMNDIHNRNYTRNNFWMGNREYQYDRQGHMENQRTSRYHYEQR